MTTKSKFVKRVPTGTCLEEHGTIEEKTAQRLPWSFCIKGRNRDHFFSLHRLILSPSRNDCRLWSSGKQGHWIDPITPLLSLNYSHPCHYPFKHYCSTIILHGRSEDAAKEQRSCFAWLCQFRKRQCYLTEWFAWLASQPTRSRHVQSFNFLKTSMYVFLKN